MTSAGLGLSDIVHACGLILSNPLKWGPDMVDGARGMLAGCKRELDGPDDACTTHEEVRLRTRLRLEADVLLAVPGAKEAARKIVRQERRHLREFLRHGMWQPSYREENDR